MPSTGTVQHSKLVPLEVTGQLKLEVQGVQNFPKNATFLQDCPGQQSVSSLQDPASESTLH